MAVVTPIEAIKRKCRACMAARRIDSGAGHIEVEQCPFPRCSLYPYRLGYNEPPRKRAQMPQKPPIDPQEG